MKKLLLSIPVLFAVGCKSQPAETPAGADQGKTAFTKQLEAIPPSQRADYVKAHLSEAMASAGIKAPTKPH